MVLVWLVWCWAGVAAAATLRFDVPGPAGPVKGVVGTSLAVTDAVLTAGTGSDLFIYRSGDFGIPKGGGFCALSSGFVCRGQATLTFEQPVNGLSFNGRYAGRGDRARVSVFAGDVLLRTVVVRRNGRIDFSDLEGVTAITFADASRRFGTGIAYARFRYTLQPPPVTPVPVPPAGAMMIASLALLAGRAALAGKGRAVQGAVRAGSC
jgi:hypothetical protein